VAEPLISRGGWGPLLAAKCSIPPPRPGGVVRRRLHDLLLANASTRLTAVAAPAGWGKTTLLSHWAHDPLEHRRVAWVSLDESDDEPVRFWTYVMTALRPHGLGAGSLSALGAPGVDPIDVAVPLLLNELESAADAVVLVLDDYHLLSDSRVHEGVEFLLAYLPPALRLVVAGRADPPLPLPRLRARGELTEIRAADLRFSAPEAGALVGSVGAVGLDASAVHGLCERTEGWAAGLQLAAITVRGAAAAPAALDAIRGDDRHILDYFTAEVFDRLPAAHRDLLVRASVLERLSGPLCDAVLQRTGSAAILDGLSRADLFVVALDRDHEWYRCHRLFRDALRHQLDPETAREDLGRAADWFLEHGYLEDAIEHRIDAGDDRGAAELLRASAPWFVERGASGIARLGDRLAPAIAHADPALCVSLAWAAAISGRFARMGPWLDAAERRPDGDPPVGWHDLRAALATMRALQRLAEADVDRGVACAESAVALEPDPALPGYVLVRHLLGTAYLAGDRPSEAVAVLTDAWHTARTLDVPPLLSLQAACSLALAHLNAGSVEQARQVCLESAPAVAAEIAEWGDAAALGIARLYMVEGRLALRDGDLLAAQTSLRRAVVLSKVWGLGSQVVLALTSLAEAELAVGDRAAATAALDEARDVAGSEPIWPFVLRELEATTIRVGRRPARPPRRTGVLIEELTDRELSILRMLAGSANQREIGAALFLSINTVKGYAKSLYRKLDVGTRQDAVERARALKLI
jgi:LuxR family transcriptional regulator, maltose regulon positive regulatory protein